MDIQKVVLERLDALGWTRYQLTEEMRRRKSKASARTVYGFLAGENEIKHKALAEILDAMGLELIARKR